MSSAERNGSQEDTRVGRVLAGRYRLLRLLGHGGMGSVYEAVHVHTDKRVAVKLLSTSLSRDLKLVARFRREAMAASRLKHENCVHIDDYDEDTDGTFYIAMELVDGHGLADELRRVGPLAWERVARIAVQLLKALDAAHAAGVLHRDLKPQNVMLTQKADRRDIVKVVDFGIAKLTTTTAEEQGALTVPGTIFGTPEYMSPEQARGEPLDARSDLYSAAVVLWHMLLGRSPFRGASVRETLMKVFADDPPSPAEERPTAGIPRVFESVLRRGLEKKREDRYPDAASFLEALIPFVPGEADLPRRPAPGLAVDGAPPPSTIDDNAHRSVTLALPEEPAPSAVAAESLSASSAPGVGEGPLSAEAMTRFGALPTIALPTSPPGAPALSTAPTVVRPVPLEPGATAPQATRSKARLSGAALASVSVVALGLAALAGFAWLRSGHDDVPAVADAGTPALVVDAPLPLPDVEPRRPDPIERDAALFRAERALNEPDLAAAALAFDEAIAADPTSAKAHVGRATVAMQLSDWAAARDHFESAMALDPEYREKLKPIHARATERAAKAHPP